jgi:hypothetical protein
VSANGGQSYPGFVNWITAAPPWDIGLAPLADTAFNRSKSVIKVLDYAAMGLAALASDMPVYQGSLAAGVGGRLVRNDPDAWYAALSLLVRDRAERARLAEGAMTAFRAGGTLASQAATRRAAWLGLVSGRGADAPEAEPVRPAAKTAATATQVAGPTRGARPQAAEPARKASGSKADGSKADGSRASGSRASGSRASGSRVGGGRASAVTGAKAAGTATAGAKVVQAKGAAGEKRSAETGASGTARSGIGAKKAAEPAKPLRKSPPSRTSRPTKA